MNEYEELIDQFIQDIDGVEAPKDEYRAALRAAIYRLQLALEAAGSGE